MTVDLGTGDGRFVLSLASASPARLVLGIDPVAAAMAEASRRAAMPPRRGGLSNALFVVASAEALPAEVCGVADLVTVNLPWGSLLRGALALDRDAASGIAGLVRPSGRVELLLAPSERDRLAAEVDVETRLAGSFADDWLGYGLTMLEARPASADDLAGTRTTWARRLDLGRRADRAAWRLVLGR